MSAFAIVIERSPYVFTTAGVSSILSYSDGELPEDATILEGSLAPIDATLSERLRPIDGDVEVSGLDFVLYDANDAITDTFTRDLQSTALTYLTASVTTAATSITVQNSAAVYSGSPRVVWVGTEAMEVTAAPTSTTLSVTRGKYATTPGPIEVDSATAVLPEVFSYPSWLIGSRVKLYRVSGTTATLRWVGYVKYGPATTENGAAYVISAIPAWDQEAAALWGSPTPAATLYGYDSQALAFTINNADRSAQATSIEGSRKANVWESRDAAIRHALTKLAVSLEAAGATAGTVRGSVGTSRSGGTRIKVQYQGFSKGTAQLRLGTEVYDAETTEIGGTVEQTWEIPARDGGALVRLGFGLGPGSDLATVVRPHVGLTGTNWSTATGSRPGVTLTPVLVGDVSDDVFLELDPQGQASPGPVAGDTAFTKLADGATGTNTFHASARWVSRDPGRAPEVPFVGLDSAGRNLLFADTALPLRTELRVDAEHWLDALRSILEDDTYATAGSDSRNWSWPQYDATRRQSRDDMGAVSYRTNGNATIGDLVKGEAALRGCCVTVDGSGKLGIIHIRAPRATETPAATITLADLVVGSPPLLAPSDDGLVTDVRLVTPLRAMTLRDAVALGRYRSQRTIEVSSQSTRRNPGVEDDPINFVIRAVGKLLGLWRNQLWVHTIPVQSGRFGSTCTLGAVVSFESYNTPNRSGSRGFTGGSARKGVVLGRSEDLASGTLTLEILELPTSYGFAPCARVASVTGSVLTLASAYAGDAGDYAGSGLTGYEQTTSDKGAGWFAAGDKVQLALRDSATYTVESFTVLSADEVAGKITLTASVPTSPTNWVSLASTGIVDVIFDGWSTVGANQRVFAAVGDETTRTIASTTANQRWST